MTGEDQQLQAPACSAQRGLRRGRRCGLPGLGGLGPESGPTDTGRLLAKQRAQHEQDGRGAVHQPLGLASPMPAVSRTLGMLGNRDSAGQLVGLVLCWTSTALEPPELPRDYRPGRDAAEEEEGRGGAWRDDVLSRWRRESEETVPPGWPSVSVHFTQDPSQRSLQTLGRGRAGFLEFERWSGRRWNAVRSSPLGGLGQSAVGFRGSGSWAEGRAAEAEEGLALIVTLRGRQAAGGRRRGEVWPPWGD